MIYLTGVTNSVIQDELVAAGFGLMATVKKGSPAVVDSFPCYGADNGAFTDKWDEDGWLRWLSRLNPKRCLFAVAPDVYPNAQASLDRGLEYTFLLREMGFPAAIVAQDGAERIDYPWDEFDCLFIGGERTTNPKDEWKVSPQSESLIKKARSKGKWVHMGRVNSHARMEWARLAGCHSADGTFLKYGLEKNVPRMKNWIKQLDYEVPFQQMVSYESPSHPTHRHFLFDNKKEDNK